MDLPAIRPFLLYELAFVAFGIWSTVMSEACDISSVFKGLDIRVLT
jgi:hypothetical protein